ncbi:uncharacterized protein LOC143493421 isoform X2 [Brachyhypopomus gauderio]|uniref:uncharacterized protein LOC143493421 isoform X2 n=1 Tax=Brachyhypopomus gauderio TaxID=698409 RepID=UPI00404376BB
MPNLLRSVKMLVLAVLVMMACCGSEGRVLSKCELRSSLKEAFPKLQKVIHEDILAQFVCTVEHTSWFNTSLISIDNFNSPHLIPTINGPNENDLYGMKDIPVLQVMAEEQLNSEDKLLTEDNLAPKTRLLRGLTFGEGSDDDSSGSGSGEGPSDISGSGSRDLSGSGIESGENSGSGSGDQSGDGSGSGSGDQSGDGSGSGSRDLSGSGSESGENSGSGSGDQSGDGSEGFKRKSRELSNAEEEGGSGNADEIIIDMSGDGPTEGSGNEGSEESSKSKIKKRYIHNEEDVTDQEEIDEDEDDLFSRTLQYGIFQLNDIACNSESISLNLCELDCTALIDDDITDDIACLKILNEMGLSMVVDQQCLTVVPSDYFEECS